MTVQIETSNPTPVDAAGVNLTDLFLALLDTLPPCQNISAAGHFRTSPVVDVSALVPPCPLDMVWASPPAPSMPFRAQVACALP